MKGRSLRMTRAEIAARAVLTDARARAAVRLWRRVMPTPWKNMIRAKDER